MELGRFAEQLAGLRLTHEERAIALLWFYRQTDLYEDRTASELAEDLHKLDFAKPRSSRLYLKLLRSRYTVRGNRTKSFKINRTISSALDEKYGPLTTAKRTVVTDSVLPAEWFPETPKHLGELVRQINGSYDAGFYDGSATLMRRLMECLLIETYIRNSRSDEIKVDGNFKPLDQLINKATNDTSLHLNRNSKRDMDAIKKLGDTAAHDRKYITHPKNIDDLKQQYMRLIQELLTLSKFHE